MLPKIDRNLSSRIISLREKIVAHFDAGDWEEIGLLTGHSDIIDGHSRLLRSLNWGDQDYSGNVLSVVKQIAELDPKALDNFDALLNRKYPEESHYVSAKPSPHKITFAPHVFELQDVTVEDGLVSVMMPFSPSFDKVYDAIKLACDETLIFRCKRADDIWEESVMCST